VWSHRAGNRPESTTKRIFRPILQVAAAQSDVRHGCLVEIARWRNPGGGEVCRLRLRLVCESVTAVSVYVQRATPLICSSAPTQTVASEHGTSVTVSMSAKTAPTNETAVSYIPGARFTKKNLRKNPKFIISFS